MADEEKQIPDNEKRVIADGFVAVAKDLQSHKAALARLTENQEAEHALVGELAKMVNDHEALLAAYRAAWTENFENLAKLVNEQSKAITAMRDLILPPTPPRPGPVN